MDFKMEYIKETTKNYKNYEKKIKENIERLEKLLQQLEAIDGEYKKYIAIEISNYITDDKFNWPTHVNASEKFLDLVKQDLKEQIKQEHLCLKELVVSGDDEWQ